MVDRLDKHLVKKMVVPSVEKLDDKKEKKKVDMKGFQMDCSMVRLMAGG